MAIELTPSAEVKLAALCAVTHETPSQIASDAVEHLHRSLIGLPTEDEDAPKIETGHFRKRYSYNPAEIVLRQTDATDFALEESFRYIDDDGADRWVVPDTDVTDLASVPAFLTWLVPRYGRHTFAALLHDHLQDSTIDDPVTSAQADEVFRDAMADTGVPLLRRWLMWAAVRARTRKNAGGLGMVATLGWLLVYGVIGCLGFPILVLAVVAGWLSVGPVLAIGAVVFLSPFVLGLAWRRDYRFAVLTALGVLVVGYTALLDVLVYGIYAAFETLSRLFQKHPKPIRASKLKPSS